jgi:type I restriction enzyme S subunit
VNRVNSRELVGKAAAIRPGLEQCVFESKKHPRSAQDQPRFVSFALQSNGQSHFTRNAQQVVGMASISQPQVAAFPLPLPPLDEQQRIVAEMEKQFTRLEAGVASLKRVQAALKRYRASVLKAACEGRLADSNKAKWQYRQLGELAQIKYGKNLPTKNLSDSGFPVFGANGVIGYHTSCLYQDEQVLISCRGAYSGKINLSPRSCFVTNNSLVLELPEDSAVEKRFLFYALQSVDRSKMVTGSAQPQVTINNAEVVVIPLPPLAEQHRIFAEVERRLSVIEELEAVVTANLKRANRLRQSILHRAFSGQL